MKQRVSDLARPIREVFAEARRYGLAQLRQDVVAGLSVSVVAIPQSMAYALVAGVPAEYGLYTVVIQCLLGVFLNASRYISLGPVNTHSLLVASVVTHVISGMGTLSADERGGLYLQLVIGLTLLKGLIQLTLAAARMAALVKYISHSVIAGFTAGAGVLIAVGQLPVFLGLDVRDTPHLLPGAFGILERVAVHLDQIDIWSIVAGSAALATIISVRYSSKKLPGPLLGVIVAALLAWVCGWTHLAMIGSLPEVLPVPKLPALGPDQFEALLGGALALSILGMLETYSVGKVIRTRTDERVSANRQLFAQGLINFGSSFFSCIPGSASLTRSVLNVEAGASTRFAGAYNAIAIFCLMLFFAPLVVHVPLCSLAAVLFVIGFQLIDRHYVRYTLRSSLTDSAVLLGTFLATLTLPLHYAIFLGIFLSLALYLRHASRLQLVEMIPTDEGPFLEEPVEKISEGREIVFLQLEGDLFFGVADELENRLKLVADNGARVVILRLKRTHYIDLSALRVLEQFTQNMQTHSGAVVLCGVKPELMTKIRSFGLLDLIGPDNVFQTTYGIFASAERALQRAQAILDGPAHAGAEGKSDG